MKTILYLLLIAVISSCGKKDPIYKDSSQSVESRVNDLLKRMTLEEKILQMQDLTYNDFYTNGELDTAKMSNSLKGMSYGSIFGAKLPAETLAKYHTILRKYNNKNNRLGIPIIGEAESLHGLIQDGSTIFPQAIALGSTFKS